MPPPICLRRRLRHPIMNSSGLLKWLMIPIAALVIWAGIKLFSHGSSIGSKSVADELSGRQLTAQEAKDLGVGGDTPHDTLATLVGQVKQLRNEVKASMEDGRAQKEENERLRARESTLDARIQDTLNSERERLHQDREQSGSAQQQTQTLLQDLQRRVDALGGQGLHEDLPVGLGLEDSDFGSTDDPHLRWYEPQDRPQPRAKTPAPHAAPRPQGFRLPGDAQPPATEDEQSGLTGNEERLSGEPRSDVPAAPGESIPRLHAQPADVKPVYTIPTNATLMGSVAMTALVGRVPVDGTVNDPFPFKVVIGADNLTANGIELPDVAGAIVSGTASGDWTLSCVRGLIRSVTFVFHDGTVRTLPSDTAREVEGVVSTHTGLGWISDPYGIPCVSGVRRSNAVQYLTSQMLITAAAAGAAASIDSKSASNISFINGSNGDTLGT